MRLIGVAQIRVRYARPRSCRSGRDASWSFAEILRLPRAARGLSQQRPVCGDKECTEVSHVTPHNAELREVPSRQRDAKPRCCLLPRWPIRHVLKLVPANWRATIERPEAGSQLAAASFASGTRGVQAVCHGVGPPVTSRAHTRGTVLIGRVPDKFPGNWDGGRDQVSRRGLGVQGEPSARVLWGRLAPPREAGPLARPGDDEWAEGGIGGRALL